MSNKIDWEKDSNKLEIPAKNSLLFSEITRSNLIDQKRQKELSGDLSENGTLCNTSVEIALFEDKEENIEKIDQGIYNLSLSQSDFPLVDIVSSFLKDEEKVPILRPNINITNTSTANNICTQGNDTSVSLSQLVDESENEVSPPVTSKRIKGYFCSDNVFNLNKRVLNEIEIQVLEKGLGFVPTPNLISEEDVRRDFREFNKKMRCK